MFHLDQMTVPITLNSFFVSEFTFTFMKNEIMVANMPVPLIEKELQIYLMMSLYISLIKYCKRLSDKRIKFHNDCISHSILVI